MNPLKRLMALCKKNYRFFLSFTHKSWANTALFIISTSESVFFPLPTDLWLWPICLTHPRKAISLSVKTMGFSVLGALIGYAIGHYLGVHWSDWIQANLTSDHWQTALQKIKDNTFELVFIGAVSFLPFKVVTLSAGVLGAPLIPFLLSSIIGRSVRFVIPGVLFFFFGKQANIWIQKHFSVFSLILGLVVMFYMFFKFLS